MRPDAKHRRPAAVITREKLLDGSLTDAFRAKAPPGMKMRSDAELKVSLAQTLAGCDPHQDVSVFGYGSLMWNPAFEHADARKAYVHGWSRRFCLRMVMGRGSEAQPGLMLALDRGGACYGLSFRIPAAQVAEELRLLWRREMLSGAYEARWVGARMDSHRGDTRQRVLTFVANRQHPRYMGNLSMARQAEMLATGEGTLGSSRQYFDSTLSSLAALGVRDASLERIRRALGAHPGAGLASDLQTNRASAPRVSGPTGKPPNRG